MLRMAILASHPIQYQAPLFRALAARGDVAFKVFFCWDFGVKTTRDPGFGQAIRWDIPLLDGYDHTFVPNLSRQPGTHHFGGLVNPDAPREIHRFRPDVIVVHGYAHATELWVLASARLRGVPVLLRGESNLLRRRSPWTRAVKRVGLGGIYRSVAGALAIGKLNADYCAHYGLPRSRIFLAPYTVDNAFFRDRLDEARTGARRMRDELGIGQDDPVVLYAAKLIPAKSCATLIHAFGSTSRGRAALVIVGDGPLRGELLKLAKRYPSAAIHFLGFINQSRMPAAYALGNLFVLPSVSEPWGLAVNEAMNLGLAVVVSDQVGCAPDLVYPDNGWVFPAGDSEALGRILDAALADREGLARRGLASSARIADWDISHTAQGFVHAARSVTHPSGPGAE